MDREIHFHTNIPAPYRQHLFELLAKEFPGATFWLHTVGMDADRPWTTDVSAWACSIRSAEPFWFSHSGKIRLSKAVIRSLLRQRFGTVRVVSYLSSPLEMMMVCLSAVLRHTRLIMWNDAGFPEKADALARQSWRKSIRFLNWLTVRCSCGVFTAGDLGRRYSIALGHRSKKIINTYFSHDVETYQMFLKNHREEARERIRAQLQITYDKIVLLNISRLLDWKRLIDLAGALKIVDQDYIDVARKCELILIGDGEERSHEEILKRFRHIKVHLVKQMPPEEIMSYYCASDLFVFPSEGDIWGLVVNEALSMGIPVICTDRIGAAEMIEDGKNGFLVPSRSPELLAEKIVQLCENPALLGELSAEAKTIGMKWNSHLGVKELGKFIRSH